MENLKQQEQEIIYYVGLKYEANKEGLKLFYKSLDKNTIVINKKNPNEKYTLEEIINIIQCEK